MAPEPSSDCAFPWTEPYGVREAISLRDARLPGAQPA